MMTLVAMLCYLVANGQDYCKTVVVMDTNSSYAQAGKVDEPIDMPPMTIKQCMGFLGQEAISVWMAEHPIYHDPRWHLGGWNCYPGLGGPERKA